MKTNLLKILTLSSIVALTSCGKSTKKVGIFVYDEQDTFIRSLENEILHVMENDYNVFDTKYAEINQTLQNEQIVDCIENNSPDLLLVNIVDRLAASSIIEKANLTKTPVIFFNREPLIQDLKDTTNIFYVGISPAKEGELQAELIDELLGGNENFIKKFDKNGDKKVGTYVLKGSLGHQDSELRIKNSITGLKNKGYNLDLLSVKYCDWQRNYARDEFSIQYDKIKDDLELVISANDDMALGVIDYLKTLEDYDSTIDIIDQYFPIVGNDATQIARDSIKKGELSGTIINDAIEQSKAIKAIAECIFSEKPNKWQGFEYTFDDEYFVHVTPKKYFKE